MVRNKKRKKYPKQTNLRKTGKPKHKYFTLTNSPKKYKGFSNKFINKANIHGICYKNGTFSNVKFHSCILTKCNFRDAKFEGVDFICCNLKKSFFQNTILKEVTFYNCKINDVNFKNSIFSNVIFMSMNIKVGKNFPCDGYELINKYPTSIDESTILSARKLSLIDNCYKYHVLNVNKNKVNIWYLNLLIKHFKDEKMVLNMLEKLSAENTPTKMFTLYSYLNYIDKYKNK